MQIIFFIVKAILGRGSQVKNRKEDHSAPSSSKRRAQKRSASGSPKNLTNKNKIQKFDEEIDVDEKNSVSKCGIQFKFQ